MTTKKPCIFLISDLHFNKNISKRRLAKIMAVARKSIPTHSIITGDIIDSIDDFKDKKVRAEMLTWLEELGKLAPLFICLGNHEFKEHVGKSRKHKKLSAKSSKDSKKLLRYEPLIEALKAIPNCHLLDNSDFCDKDIYIYGLTAPLAYWGHEHRSENKTILEKAINEANFSPRKDHYNFFLFHSPLFLSDPAVEALLRGFDYTVSGHMHGGVVPDFLAKIWHSDRGLVGPTKTFLPHQSRNKQFTKVAELSKAGEKGPKHIILGAVTTLASRPLHLFQFFFAPKYLIIKK